MASNEVALFAQTTYRHEFKKFGIKTDDRRRHMYFIGKTGMGKSTVLENMIVGDIRAGRGVAVVDPHGDLAEKVIQYIPVSRVNEVVYFNPADIDYPIAFNVVEQVEPHLRHLVASGLIGVFQKLWADSWGPRLEYILRNAILAILDFPGSTLLGVVRMLSDKNYRKRVVSNIKDPVVKAFWEKEFSGYADKFAAEAVSPIQNKVGQFLSSSLMRNIIGQVKSAVNLREIMDNGKILIMNLSKGRIGEDNSALLGAMMITKIQLASMSRVDVPERDRRDFYLYIDEFQNFSTDSFTNILSEARKYRLNLILAHQYIEQLGEKVEAAVFGNIGTMVVFRVGAADAEELVKEFTPTFSEEDLVNLPKYEMYLKLMIDGVASAPFSALGLPPLAEEEKSGNLEKVIAYSRQKYASDRRDVEDKIMRWHENYGEEKEEKTAGRGASSRTFRSAGSTPSRNNFSPAATPPAAVNRPASRNLPLSTPSSPTVSPSSPPSAGPPARSFVSPSSPAPASRGYEAICDNCGRPTIVSFIPDGIRPVYCRDCLMKKKEEKRLELEERRLAKQKEKAALELEAARQKAIPSLTLDDLKNRAPVDFKGRVIKEEKVREKEEVFLQPPKNNKNKENPAPAKRGPERDLAEGEEVTISDNKF